MFSAKSGVSVADPTSPDGIASVDVSSDGMASPSSAFSSGILPSRVILESALIAVASSVEISSPILVSDFSSSLPAPSESAIMGTSSSFDITAAPSSPPLFFSSMASSVESVTSAEDVLSSVSSRPEAELLSGTTFAFSFSFPPPSSTLDDSDVSEGIFFSSSLLLFLSGSDSGSFGGGDVMSSLSSSFFESPVSHDGNDQNDADGRCTGVSNFVDLEWMLFLFISPCVVDFPSSPTSIMPTAVLR
mmetsp:Transcript_23660/g.50122  ORF Transcript_23660/g.50122 Transcript_23660/m.50122 type:complete len:246 (-) Transcript_23660:218-955(-)